MNNKFSKIVSFIRKTFSEPENNIILHDPRFCGNERKYLLDAINSNFVSSVGEYVKRFENDIAQYTGAKFAVATANGTSALHICLLLAAVHPDDEVITQPVSFVATCNAISYCNAKQVFVDVDKDTMGMSPEKLEDFLKKNAIRKIDGYTYNAITGRRFAAIAPMHTFGNPCRIDEIESIAREYNIPLVEDTAESMGSFYKGKHTGLFGQFGAISFNGNKIITTGGGGMIITNDEAKAKLAKHITTTAKIPHPWEYRHDYVGYNYRLTNLAAALGCAQIEQLERFVQIKRELAQSYAAFFQSIDIDYNLEIKDSRSNYWLNAIILKNREERDAFLKYTNDNKVMTRPIWILNNKLDMYKACQCADLSNAEWLEDRVVNIPSSVIIPDYYSNVAQKQYC